MQTLENSEKYYWKHSKTRFWTFGWQPCFI